MLYAVGNYNTTREDRSRWGKSIPVRVRIPSYVKETIRSVAKEKGITTVTLKLTGLYNHKKGSGGKAGKDWKVVKSPLP